MSVRLIPSDFFTVNEPIPLPELTLERLRTRLAFVPHSPGVYLMRDVGGRVIYVGKAKNLRRRLRDYFASKILVDPKIRTLVDSVTDFEVHTTGTEQEALLLEERLIGDFLPRFNISLRQGRRRYWIMTDLADDFPKLEVFHVKPSLASQRRVLGPYASQAIACWLVRWVNRKYGLKSCAPKNPDATHFRHCQEHIVNGCSAPCVGRISLESYREKANKAVQWLEQPRWRLVRFMKEEMRGLAASRQFEKAAQWRDMISWLDSAGSLLPPRGLKVNRGLAEAQQEALRVLMHMNKLKTLECFDISHLGGRGNVASMVRFVDGLPEKSKYRYYRLTVKGSNDFAAIKEAVSRRYRRGNPPDLVVVDGGLPQLAAAKEALLLVGCKVPLIALAKQEERIFFTDGTNLKLPHDSSALHLVQRIRDEAHRTANGYTRRKSRKNVTLSILSAVPGLGEELRRTLLKEFGSVERLRKADKEDLQKVSGVGIKLAERIIRCLQD